MSAWGSISVGLSAGLVGAIAGFGVATAFIEWYRVPAREGIAGLFGMAFVLLALIGSVILGVIVARHLAASGSPSFLKALGLSSAIIVAVGVILLALCWLFADIEKTQPSELEKSPEQIESEKLAETDAAFGALTRADPLPLWLSYTRYGNPEARIKQAASAIQARPTFVAEMTHEILEGQPEASQDALQAMEHFEQPPVELDAPVRRVGVEIAEALRAFNAMPIDDPARDAAASRISQRFSAWMVAAGALQDKGGISYVPELQQIATLARAGQDNFIIRINIVRVASFYLKQWANIEPLPDDPPPR